MSGCDLTALLVSNLQKADSKLYDTPIYLGKIVFFSLKLWTIFLIKLLECVSAWITYWFVSHRASMWAACFNACWRSRASQPRRCSLRLDSPSHPGSRYFLFPELRQSASRSCCDGLPVWRRSAAPAAEEAGDSTGSSPAPAHRLHPLGRCAHRALAWGRALSKSEPLRCVRDRWSLCSTVVLAARHYVLARPHLLLSGDAEAAACFLVDMQRAFGRPDERDMFLAQAVLELLALGRRLAAAHLFAHFLRAHPDLCPTPVTLAARAASSQPRPPFASPLLDFLYLLLLSIDRLVFYNVLFTQPTRIRGRRHS